MQPLEPNQVLARYTPEGGDEITLTTQIVRSVISTSDTVTDKEIMLFVSLCRTYRLDPFIREAHLIKYGQKPATLVVGKDVFVKRAQKNPRFEGFEAGITVLSPDGTKMVRREGSMQLPGEQIVGGWARVHVHGYAVPMFEEVGFWEYAGKKADGSLNQQWASKPATMIRKVALVHALREAFPTDFTGLYDASEMGIEEPDDKPIRAKQPEYEVPDDYGPDGWSEMDGEQKAAFIEEVAGREPARIMPDIDHDMAQDGAYMQGESGWEEF